MTIDILEVLRAKRGYLLPYHKMLAAHDPALLKRYDDFYEKLTLDRNLLSPRWKEFVWIAILATAREGVGSLHLDRAQLAGLTREEMEAALSLSALSESFPALLFGMDNWAGWLSRDKILDSYLGLVAHAAPDIEPALVELALLVCHGTRRDRLAFELHLQRFEQSGGKPAELSEALSYLFIPMGANLLIDIVELWLSIAEEKGLMRPY